MMHVPVLGPAERGVALLGDLLVPQHLEAGDQPRHSRRIVEAHRSGRRLARELVVGTEELACEAAARREGAANAPPESLEVRLGHEGKRESGVDQGGAAGEREGREIGALGRQASREPLLARPFDRHRNGLGQGVDRQHAEACPQHRERLVAAAAAQVDREPRRADPVARGVDRRKRAGIGLATARRGEEVEPQRPLLLGTSESAAIGHRRPRYPTEGAAAVGRGRGIVAPLQPEPRAMPVGPPAQPMPDTTSPDARSTPALSVRDLRFGYPGRPFALSLTRLEVARGEQILLTGASGSGKSTLLQLVAGLLEPSAGRIEVAGTHVHGLRGAARDAFRGRSIGMVFQTFHLLVGFTAAENVAIALLFAGRTGPDSRDRPRELLATLGIDEPDAPVERLSIGQQQRVAVARALAARPALVLADEPTASLDPSAGAVAIDLLRDTCRAEGAALLVVSHDPALVGRFDRAIRIEELRTPSGAAA